MVNKEIRGFVHKTEQARKIEIYRKNTSDLDKEAKEEPSTKISSGKSKINIFKTFKLILWVCFVFVIGGTIFNIFFHNPFKELQETSTQKSADQITIQPTEEVQSTPTEPSENLFREKDGSFKITNIIFIGVGTFLIFKLLIENVIR